MAKSRNFSADRRKFLKGAAVAGAATLATPGRWALGPTSLPDESVGSADRTDS